jgi:hypothetical protein
LGPKRRRRVWHKSLLYGFVRARQLDGTLSSRPSVGVSMSSAYRVAEGWGWVSESRCPRRKKGDPWPPTISSDLDDIAKFNRSFMHYRVRTLDELKRAAWRGTGAGIEVPLHPGWRAPVDGVITLPAASFPKPTVWHAIRIIGYDLKSGSFCSCGQPENSHTAGILPIGDEFRERIIFRGIEEIIGKRPP